MVTTVHYIKHWDNDTKGYIEIGDAKDILDGIHKAHRQLRDEILDEDILGQFEELYTITKAELGESSNYVGHKAGF